MKHTFTYIVLFFLCSMNWHLLAQNNAMLDAKEEKPFSVRGSVIESDTYDPIENVEIIVNGGQYTKTNVFGEFKIEVKKGDELVIQHKDFETVYYTIVNNERIKVKVEPAVESNVTSIDKRKNLLEFNSLIDSAETTLPTILKCSFFKKELNR